MTKNTDTINAAVTIIIKAAVLAGLIYPTDARGDEWVNQLVKRDMIKDLISNFVLLVCNEEMLLEIINIETKDEKIGK